jgi:anthranilate 1,2-dioxygenase large subunit
MNYLSNRPKARSWPAEALTRVPTWIYTDKDLFQRELDRFFYGQTWNYVGFECEVPSPGSFKRSWVGMRPVVLTRDVDGSINVIENRCSHRSSMVCWQSRGEATSLTCPYHQWNYDLKGNLLGLPFLRGVLGKGGMPRDFNKTHHGLTKLRVAVRNGVVWASFAADGPSFEEYCGPQILKWYDRMFAGRELVVLGHSRQTIKGNWKLYHENIRDSYHATILHSFFVTFGVWRADMEFFNDTTENGRHEFAVTRYSDNVAQQRNEVTHEIREIKEGLTLRDPTLFKPIDEFGDRMFTIFNIFPSAHFQQYGNALVTRHIIPKSVDEIELCWTQFGYADDSEDLRVMRLKQANIIGPAGFVSAEDGEIIEFVQQTVNSKDTSRDNSQYVLKMGGNDIDLPNNTMADESLLRSFLQFYRQEMGLDVDITQVTGP